MILFLVEKSIMSSSADNKLRLLYQPVPEDIIVEADKYRLIQRLDYFQNLLASLISELVWDCLFQRVL